MNVEGLAVIVTGAASGLGAASARLLAGKGAKVTIFDLNADAGEATAKEVGGLFQSVNVTDEASVWLVSTLQKKRMAQHVFWLIVQVLHRR